MSEVKIFHCGVIGCFDINSHARVHNDAIHIATIEHSVAEKEDEKTLIYLYRGESFEEKVYLSHCGCMVPKFFKQYFCFII